VKRLLVKKLPDSLNWLNMNVRSTKGKKELEPQSKPKKRAKCLNVKDFREAINSAFHSKTDQSCGIKAKANG